MVPYSTPCGAWRHDGVKTRRTTKPAPAKPLDLFRELRAEYAATTQPRFVDVGTGTFLAVRGSGAPGGDAFQRAIGALYGVAYTIKMTRKHKLKLGPDYKIAPLEGLYWTPAEEEVVELQALETLSWQLMIRTPDFITQADVRRAAETLESRGKGTAGRNVRVEAFTEGRCVQMLHVGSYAAESQTLAVMRSYVREAGLSFRGRHHEIYLSDPSRVPEERLRTILRMPVG